MRLRLINLAILAAIAVQWAGAQPFGITAQVGSSILTVSPGGTLNIAAPSIGAATAVRISISYRGTSSAIVTGVDSANSGDFRSTVPDFPISLTPGQNVIVSLTYVPTSGAPSQGQITVSYFEEKAAAPVLFNINIVGTAPDLVYNYAVAGGNAQAVGDGGVIQFPATAVNTTRVATFTVLNRGSAVGTVSNIALSGSAFQLGGLQIPPYAVPAGSALSFTVTFAPIDRTAQSGSLLINFANRTYTFKFQGTGTAANYLYSVIAADGTATAVQAGQAIGFPNTNLGSNSAITLRVINNGNAPGTIPAMTVAGPGFSLANAPFLPLTLAIGAQAELTVSFAPTIPGAVSGGLKVGDDTFNFAATGIGPLLTYTYVSGSTTNALVAGSALLFSPTKIGSFSTLRFTAENKGNTAAAINTIFLTGSDAFTLSGVAALPLNLAPNTNTTFTIVFAPVTNGVSQASIQVGTASFPVSGSATAPDPLPAIIFSGPNGQVQPLLQPVYRLGLSKPYSIDVVGTLTLSFSSAVFATDPSVQFASGGKTVDFFIPAGYTSALFPNNSDQIAIQTGTVAGSITIVPSFSTPNGINLTPSSFPFVSLNIAQAAPSITGITITNQTATGFTLAITGFATSRAVNLLQLQITPATGIGITNTTFVIPVDTAFQAWYQSATSQSTGSSFTATLPVTLVGNSTAPTKLTDAIQSISVSLTNAQGTSPAQTISIP